MPERKGLFSGPFSSCRKESSSLLLRGQTPDGSNPARDSGSRQPFCFQFQPPASSLPSVTSRISKSQIPLGVPVSNQLSFCVQPTSDTLRCSSHGHENLLITHHPTFVFQTVVKISYPKMIPLLFSYCQERDLFVPSVSFENMLMVLGTLKIKIIRLIKHISNRFKQTMT